MGIGTTELLVILVIVMILFGGSKLPQLGKGLGEGVRSFRDALRGIKDDEKNSPKDPQIDNKNS